MKDYLDSIKDYFSQKATNPILATILIVWSFKNWRLIYGLFTFDENALQTTKLDFIEDYFKAYSFYPILWESIGYGFLVFIITYVISGVGRLIVNLYDYKLLPVLSYLTDSWGPVTRDRFEQTVKELDEQRDKYDQERLARIKAIGELANLEKSVGELSLEAAKVPELNSAIEKYQNQESRIQLAEQERDQALQKTDHLYSEKIKAETAHRALEVMHQQEKEIMINDFRKQTRELEFNYVDQISTLNQIIGDFNSKEQKRINDSLGTGQTPRGNTPRTSPGGR